MFRATILFENDGYIIANVINIQIIPRTKTIFTTRYSETKVENHDEITVIYVDSDDNVKSDTVRSFNDIEIIK